MVQGPAWQGSALASLHLQIARRFWQPVSIPLVLADVHLAEPDVQPDAYCDRCRLLLPYRMGIWENPETG